MEEKLVYNERAVQEIATRDRLYVYPSFIFKNRCLVDETFPPTPKNLSYHTIYSHGSHPDLMRRAISIHSVPTCPFRAITVYPILLLCSLS